MDTKKVAEAAVAALNERAPKLDCPLCHANKWTVSANGFIVLILQESNKTVKLHGQGLTFAPLTCDNCGNTHLLNLYQLGLKELIEREQEKKAEEGKEQANDGK